MAQIRKNGRCRRPIDFMRMRTTQSLLSLCTARTHGESFGNPHDGDGAGPEPTAAPRPASFPVDRQRCLLKSWRLSLLIDPDPIAYQPKLKLFETIFPSDLELFHPRSML